MKCTFHKKTDDFNTTHELLCGTKYGYRVDATQYPEQVNCKKCLNKMLKISAVIKPRELRIGNLLQKQCNGPIYAITAMDIPLIAEWVSNKEELLPESILLTEDWLVRFGFYLHSRTMKRNIYIHYASESVVKIVSTIGTFWLYRYGTKIECVHKLQNLYFELTGEELLLVNKI